MNFNKPKQVTIPVSPSAVFLILKMGVLFRERIINPKTRKDIAVLGAIGINDELIDPRARSPGKYPTKPISAMKLDIEVNKITIKNYGKKFIHIKH